VIKLSLKCAVLLAASLMLPQLAHAGRVEVKGIGAFQYEGGFFSSDKPTDGEKEKAGALAKKNAWKNFVATLNSAKQKSIAEHEAAIADSLEKFIIDTVLIDTFKDQNARTLNVVMRVAFNDEAVSQFVEKLTVGNGQQVGRSKDSVFSFLFMARKAATITQFDARQTKVSQSETSIAEGDGSGVSSTAKTVTGGSTQRKADSTTYAVTSSQDLDAAMGEVISTSGIEYVGYDDIVESCDGVPVKTFRDEYVNSDELSSKTRAAVIKAARDCEVRYFAYGTVDSEVSMRDPATGNQRVFVSVRSQLWDISARLPRKIGSVGPKQYSGLGPNESVAGRNALSSAARELARTLVDQLNAKGIR